ncbi:SDR family oxidoreductase [Caballeronia sp. LZ034LL]|uniref:SDR family oxidoreductase n=1 Tax=Caballeronia sp. LZ034LL TaxID=3038567 RepID=UPI00285CADA7|nr:SDR family oxidoreductase [Caballeronia sp. LZ034LL]MDR5835739.1 SDR family oxidoreductase [Caballeronia sp. LZ034LL]
MSDARSPRPSILLIGASRGLGHAMAEEFVKRGWNVVGTVRGHARTPLHALADDHPEHVTIESVDITDPDQLAALRDRLAPRRFNALFVNAGTANEQHEDTIAQITTEEFIRVMVTNALSPMRAVETLEPLVDEGGLIGVMSSGQGSVAGNEKGGRELYRGSKAALNMFMRSYAARQANSQRSLLLMAPGWIRTDLGGPDAPFTMADTIPDVVSVLIEAQGKPGLRYVDRNGKTVAW